MTWKRYGLFVAVAVAAALIVASCSGSKAEPGQADVTLNGRAELTRAGGVPRLVLSGFRMRRGDILRMLEGTAVAKLATGGELELRDGTALRMDSPPFLQTGDLLVEPRAHGQLTIASQEARAVLRGPARLSQALAFTAASYRGGLELDTVGARPLEVRSLRRATIAERGVVPLSEVPIAYQASDRWDARFLGLAISLDPQLEAVSRGFSSNLAAGVHPDGTLFRQLYPDLRPHGELDSLLARTPDLPGELLVGTGITLSGTGGTFAGRWGQVFGFRSEGARWGLVALDQAVANGSALASTIEAAGGRSPLQFQQVAVAAIPPAPAPVASASPSQLARSLPPAASLSASPSPSPSTSPSPSPSPWPSPSPSPTPIPAPVPSPPPPVPPTTVPTLPPPHTGTPVDQIVDPLVQTLNNLLH